MNNQRNQCSHRIRANKVIADFLFAGKEFLSSKLQDQLIDFWKKNIEIIQYCPNYQIYRFLAEMAYYSTDDHQVRKNLVKTYKPIIAKLKAIYNNPDVIYKKTGFTRIGEILR